MARADGDTWALASSVGPSLIYHGERHSAADYLAAKG